MKSAGNASGSESVLCPTFLRDVLSETGPEFLPLIVLRDGSARFDGKVESAFVLKAIVD